MDVEKAINRGYHYAEFRTLEDFNEFFGICYYADEIRDLANEESWYTDNDFDSVLDADAINDTMCRMGRDIIIDSIIPFLAAWYQPQEKAPENWRGR